MTTENIWNDFKAELLGFIKKRINDADIAEDLLQEVFIKIHLNVNGLNEETSLTSWIYRITRNVIIDFYRKKKNLVYQEQLEDLLPEEPNETTKDFSKCMKAFIEQLPEKDQDIIEQTAFGNLSQKAYAEKASLSYTTAKSRVQRARKKLKESFIQCCQLDADQYGNILSDNCDC